MTNRPKITRILLNEKTEGGYFFFGLVSTEADYKLSQLLNKNLGLSLRSDKNIDIKGDNGDIISFSRYSFTSESSETTFNLIANRSGKDYLIRKLNKIDYFFQILDSEKVCDILNITDRLRKIDKITAIFKLAPEEIRDKNRAYLTP